MPQDLGWDEIFDRRKSGWDSITSFLSVVHALAGDAHTVVDVGCGRGWAADDVSRRTFHDVRGADRKVIGIDVDAVGVENPMVDEFRLITSDGRWPLTTAEADLVFCDYVLEHVDDPRRFTTELTRVLRPGGAFVARTISRHSPLALAARLVPNDRHPRIIERVQPGREAKDVFPTRYLMNDERVLDSLLSPDFQWTVRHRVGFEQYFLRWPRLARSIAAVEPRLPKALQMTLVIYARRA